MSMSAHIIRISLAGCLIPLAWFGTVEFPALAGVEKPKKEMRRLGVQPLPSEGQTSMRVGKSKIEDEEQRSASGQAATSAKHQVEASRHAKYQSKEGE